MAHPAYLRAKARELRIKKHLSLDELAEHLALPKTTIYCWIVDLPLGRERRASPGQRRGNLAMQAKYRRLREEAYERGRFEYPTLILEPTFRDFVALYIAEGFKRNRNCVWIGNSDERVVALSAGWIARLSTKPLIYAVQYHADQDLTNCGLSGVRLSASTARRSRCRGSPTAGSSPGGRGGRATAS